MYYNIFFCGLCNPVAKPLHSFICYKDRFPIVKLPALLQNLMHFSTVANDPRSNSRFFIALTALSLQQPKTNGLSDEISEQCSLVNTHGMLE